MSLWTDERTPLVCRIAGDIVLTQISADGSALRHRSGAVFERDGEIILARTSTTDHLPSGEAVWTKIAPAQVDQLLREAPASGGSLNILFISVDSHGPAVHRWLVPGPVVLDLLRAMEPDEQGYCHVRIYRVEERFEMGYRASGRLVDITGFHETVPLPPEGEQRLRDAIEAQVRDRASVTVRGPRRSEPTESPYIVRDTHVLSAEPIIRGTRTPVRAIVERYRDGISPEETVADLPHLTLAQVYAALSYFADHQQEITEYVEKNRVDDSLAARRPAS